MPTLGAPRRLRDLSAPLMFVVRLKTFRSWLLQPETHGWKRPPHPTPLQRHPTERCSGLQRYQGTQHGKFRILLWRSSFGKEHQLSRGCPWPEPSQEALSPAGPQSCGKPGPPKLGCGELLSPRLIGTAVPEPSEERTGDALPSSDHPKDPSAALIQHKYLLYTVYFLQQRNISLAALRRKKNSRS